MKSSPSAGGTLPYLQAVHMDTAFLSAYQLAPPPHLALFTAGSSN